MLSGVSGSGSEEVVRVAESFGNLARTLAGGDTEEVTTMVVQMATDTLSGCQQAGISLVEKGRIVTGPASGDMAKMIDDLQNQVDEGPFIDAIRDKELVRTGDLAAESRWPSFAARAHDATSVRSILALRLYVEETTIGALSLYSTQPDAFDDHDVALGAVFAAHAAIAMSSARRSEHLERMSASRDVIGRAKGILMAESDVDDETAFDMLRRASQRLNIKLTEVAERIARRDLAAD